jgi:hypothetical protein
MPFSREIARLRRFLFFQKTEMAAKGHKERERYTSGRRFLAELSRSLCSFAACAAMHVQKSARCTEYPSDGFLT